MSGGDVGRGRDVRDAADASADAPDAKHVAGAADATNVADATDVADAADATDVADAADVADVSPAPPVRSRVSPAAWPLLLLVRGYQVTLRPFLGGHCRFVPTCSDYAVEALRTHGAVRGGWLTVRRLARCQPWGGCGFDPVPERDPPGGAGR